MVISPFFSAILEANNMDRQNGVKTNGTTATFYRADETVATG